MRILIKLPNWLGDSVMITPSIQILRTAFRNCVITLIGNDLSTGIFDKNDFENIFIDETKNSKNRLKSTILFAKKINNNSDVFDLAFCFTNNFFSALLLRLIRCKNRVGYGDRSFFPLRYFLLNTKIKFKSRKSNLVKHQVLSYANLLFSVMPQSYLDSLNPKNGTKETFIKSVPELFVTNNNSSKQLKTIGICPSASFGESKMWIPSYFAELIIELLKQGFKVRIYGAKNNLENCQQILDSMKLISKNEFHNLEILVGKTNINELIKSLSECFIYVGNDSGVTHLAKALKCKIIIIFGSTSNVWGSPWSPRIHDIDFNLEHVFYDNTAVVYKHLFCSPCAKKICPLKHHNCMRLISPDEILDIVSFFSFSQ